MYTPSWLSDQSLNDSLQQQPWRWSFSQATRVIVHSGQLLRVGSDPIYRYPCAEIGEVQHTLEGWRLTVTCPALDGYHGALPYVYQDLEQEQRLLRDDDDLCALWSIFNHRSLVLTSMVAHCSNLGIRYEQLYLQGEQLAKTLLILTGLPNPTRWLPSDNLVRYSQVLSKTTTNLELLAGILEDYFDINIQLQSPPVVREELAPDCLTRLYARVDRTTRGVGYLGRNTLTGRSCYLLHSRVNVIILAETREEYNAITRDKTLAPAILEMCTLYFEGSARFRLQIKCPRLCLIRPQLTAKPSANTARLGLLSCLMPEQHPDRVIVVDFPEVNRSKKTVMEKGAEL